VKHDLYTSWSGARAAWQQLELLSNNVSNTDTAGFREQRASFELSGTGPLADASTRMRAVAWSDADGTLRTDDVPTHLALRGPGYFALADGTYTRDGSFRIDGEGRLVTAAGVPVLTEGGPVQLAPGESLTVSQDGTVAGSRTGEFGTLVLVQLDNGRPVGGNLWQGAARPTEGTAVIQGALEGSNVDPMRNMVELIEASRFFEAQQKVMSTSDDMTERLGRMRG
jgi:flagellar basal-body rod protein FlgF